jgi:hypothetical protein
VVELRQNILPYALPESEGGALHRSRHRCDDQTGANLGSDLTVFATATAVTDDCHDGVGETCTVVGILIVPAGQYVVSAGHRTSRDVKEHRHSIRLHYDHLRVFITL